MNFALLWVDALSILLLAVGTLLACIGRLHRRWIRAVLTSIVAGLPLIPLGAFAFAATVVKFSAHIESGWFGCAISLLLGYLLGACLVLYRASRKQPGLAPASATWHPAPLAFGCLAAVAFGYMTLLNMDMAVRARCAFLSVEINSVYLATLPAITSDSQNAGPLYEQAFAQLKGVREEEKRVQNPPAGNGDNFDLAEPATIAFLKNQAPTIALLRRAAALPGCRFDEDLFVPDVQTIMPQLDESRNAANVLGLDAREEIAQGHPASAIKDAAAILGMSRHLGQRPMLISALVGAGIDSIGNKVLEEALPAVTRREDLDALQKQDLPPMGRVFQQALRGEERYGLALYQDMPTGDWGNAPGKDESPQHPPLMGPGAGINGVLFRDLVLDLDAYVNLMAGLQDAAPQPYYLVGDRVQHVFGLDQSRGLLLSIVAPSFSRAFKTISIVEASDLCAQTAVAMTRFRLDHGNYPPHLADLVPAYLDAIPTDPFDGHPIRLAIKGNAWILYSIGPDGVDNGGAEMLHDKGDITFTLKSH